MARNLVKNYPVTKVEMLREHLTLAMKLEIEVLSRQQARSA